LTMKTPGRHRNMAQIRRLGVVLLTSAMFAGVATHATAFGNEGHEVIALVAQQLLRLQAQQRVASILALEPGATLASISNRADHTRNRSTAAWHYVNLPRGSDCAYVRARDC